MRAPSGIRSVAAAAVVILVVVTGGAADPEGFPPAAPTAEQIEDGRQLFRIYCVGCHGVTARGDGPASERLRPPPTVPTAGPDRASRCKSRTASRQ